MADKPHPPDAITSPTDVSPSCKTTNQTGEDPTTTYPPTLSILILQTGYTNGAGLAHIQYLIDNYNLTDFRVHWQLQPCNTGVKHVNRRSVGYDITLHYEVNGHGSVVISKEGIMRWCDYYGLDPTLLLTSLAIYSPAMGDGIVNCLQVELALKVLGLEIEDVWRFYESLPSSSRTVRLERSELETFRVDEKDEQVLMEPKGLVEFVGKVAKEASGARVFVRPSGTEALVRVYVEASTTERAEELAGEVANVVANQRVANPIG